MQSDTVITKTTAPSTPVATQSGETSTSGLTSSMAHTTSSPVCPDSDRAIYIATNKPSSLPSYEQITNSSLAYQIFCYTNFAGSSGVVMDMQILQNISSLQKCLDACALYSFQTYPSNFRAFACTGIAWGWGSGYCWLKSNVTSSSDNFTYVYPGIDGAVLVW